MFAKKSSPDVATLRPQPTVAPEELKQTPILQPVESSLLAEGFVMTGSISSKGRLDIGGVIDGDVAAAVVVVDETGLVKGEVVAASLVVHGEVIGRVRAGDVQLCAGARVRGEIAYTSLAIGKGVLFDGRATHLPDAMIAENPIRAVYLT